MAAKEPDPELVSGVRLRIIDAFADRPYAGNPAAVVLLDQTGWPDEGWMRHVAAELNLSDTAFAHPLRENTYADWALRWFTPVVEEDLCGHATLATAHAISADNGITGTVRFTTHSGILIAEIAPDGCVTLDFPAAAADEVALPDGLVHALGVTPVSVYRTGPLRDLLVVLPDEGAVRALAPDLAALADLTRRGDIRGVTATALADSSDCGYDFVSRFFAPAHGIPEDPVTGSAHTALTPYWARRLGRDNLVGLQASARTGLIRTSVVRSVMSGDRVHLSGYAVTVLDGTWLHAPEPCNAMRAMRL